MSIECGECERDLRGDHAETCSKNPANIITKLRATLSEREKELAEWRDIKEQMRCLTIYSKRDLQAKIAMQVRLREAAEKELARLRSALEKYGQHLTTCT